MRRIWRMLLLCLLSVPFCNAQNGNQINPNTQIKWPLTCTGPSGVGAYSPILNQCIQYVQTSGDTMTGSLAIVPPSGQAMLTLQSSTNPVLRFMHTQAALDQKWWVAGVSGDGIFHLSTSSDDKTNGADAMYCGRSGYTSTGCTFPGGVSSPKLTDSIGNTGQANQVPTAAGNGTWAWAFNGSATGTTTLPTNAMVYGMGAYTSRAAVPPDIYTTTLDSQKNLLMNGVNSIPTGWSQGVFLGYQAGAKWGTSTNPNMTGQQGLIAIGYQACTACQSNNGSVAIGIQAMGNVPGGSGQQIAGEDMNAVAIGPYAMMSDDGSAFESIAIGNKAYAYGKGDNSSVMVGSHVEWTGGIYNVIVGGHIGWNQGTASVSSQETGRQNVLIGGGILNPPSVQTFGDLSYSTCIGASSCAYAFTDTGLTAIGYQSGYWGPTTFTGIGYKSGSNLPTTGTPNNSALGYTALQLNGTSSDNTCLGYATCGNSVSANRITAIGSQAAGRMGAGTQELVAIGYYAGGGGYSVANQNSVLIGDLSAGFAGTSANPNVNNTVVGHQAAQNAITSVSDTTLVGFKAGYSETSGQNTYVGSGAGAGGATGGNNIAIGYNSRISGATTTGAVQLGTGTNSSSNTLQYRSWNFLDSYGNANFNTLTGLVIPGITVQGILSNLVGNSGNQTANGWSRFQGSIAVTPNSSDVGVPFPGAIVTKLDMSSANAQYGYTNASFPVTAGTTYTHCGWIYEVAGGGAVSIGSNQVTGAIVPVAAWQYICTNVTSSGTQPAKSWIIQNNTATESIVYLAGAETTQQGNFAAFLATTTPVMIPVPTVMFPYLSGGPVNLTASGILTNAPNGVATLVSGTVTVATTQACAVGGGCIYKLSNCGPNGATAIGLPSLGTVNPAVSFIINSLSSTATVVAGDTSKICWQIN